VRGKGGEPSPIVYRDVTLGNREFREIQTIVNTGGLRTRAEIALAVCKRYGWRRPGGQYAVDSVRLLLGRCEQEGLIRLPTTRRRASAKGQTRESMEWLVPAPAEPIELPAVAPLQVRPITSDERQGWRLHMQRHHYLGDCPHVGETIRYAAFWGDELVALLGWASASLHNAPRDQYVGWDAATRAQRLHCVVNNVRFLILPWIRKAHLASQVLGANLRRLSADWEALYGHRVWLAETFVDSSRFQGTCYRASNWMHLGQTQGFGRHGNQYVRHGNPKAVWVYLLHRRAREQLCAPFTQREQEPSPMPKPTVVFDPSRLPQQGQGSLYELFGGIVDFRKPQGKRHPLTFVLALATCAVLSGCKSLAAITQFGADLPREHLLLLGLRSSRAPSERTVRRIFKDDGIVSALDNRVQPWFLQYVSLQSKGLALDGKTVRGSAEGEEPGVHLVSAVTHQEGTVLAQVRVPDKTNEIKSVQPVLEHLPIEGAVVTGDAMFTQKDIARYIVEEKKADYLLTVKDNQPTLRKDIEDLGLGAFPPGA